MTHWLLPALVAPLVLGLVTVGGWFTTYFLGLRQEKRRRLERIVDVQTAVAAEIRSYRQRGTSFDIAEHGAKMEAWILAGEGANTPFVPLEPEFIIYSAMVKDIHILPQAVIDPVVLFYTQASTVALFASVLRAERYEALDAMRKNDMYQDYLRLLQHAYTLADTALGELQVSLAEGGNQ